MSTISARRLLTGGGIGAAAIILVHLFQWLFPSAAATWNSRIHDRLFQFRSDSQFFRPVYDDTLVHVDINQSTLQRLDLRRLNREHYARAISHLGAMGTAAQLVDVVFAFEQSEEEDLRLVSAAQTAGNVHFGLILLFGQDRFQPDSFPQESAARQYLDATRWKIEQASALDDLPEAVDAIPTFPRLAMASRGLGAINLQVDPDGVYRRYPLLYRYGDGVYPSIVLRTVCDYLGVSPDGITMEPGPSLRLKAARFPGSNAVRDIRIPMDSSGSMIIDFIGGWDRMNHYNFADVLQASAEDAEMALWKEELSGKIVVLSEVLSGSSDAGPVPTDNRCPLSGVHASALHTILTESFFDRVSGTTTLLMEAGLAACAVAAFVRLPAMGIGIAIIALTAVYTGSGTVAFLRYRTLFDFLFPNAMLAVVMVCMLVNRAMESARSSVIAERERDLVEKELEIGRRIQADFFPSSIPARKGWEMAASMRPAKQVAGDFYDIFTLRDGRLLAVVIGDVCDKGVGAAIFMALFRTLLRAICQQYDGGEGHSSEPGRKTPQEILKNTVRRTNDYVATTHESACMFATVFFAIIDAHDGNMHYINCGHEPPFLVSPDGCRDRLKPTGPAIGTFPEARFACRSVVIGPGELLFAFTDGVIETPDVSGRAFDAHRLQDIVCASHRDLDAMLKAVETAVDEHGRGKGRFDDLTMLAVRRGANS